MNFKLMHSIYFIDNPDFLMNFYQKTLGMKTIEYIENVNEKVFLLGYRENYDDQFNVASSCLQPPIFLEFISKNGTAFNEQLKNSGMHNVYWKIGLTMYDVQTVRSRIQGSGIEITTPSQFEDIGYVCHVKDPFGFWIELLQHDFEETHRKSITKHGLRPQSGKFTLGYPCCISHITLQTTNIRESQKFYQDILGMQLLSVQPVVKYNFVLYFFAWSDEKPPEADTKNELESREWLWKRPYAMIEVRHFKEVRMIPSFIDLNENEIGFKGIRISCDHLDSFQTFITSRNIPFENSQGYFGREIIIRNPDNLPIYITDKKVKP